MITWRKVTTTLTTGVWLLSLDKYQWHYCCLTTIDIYSCSFTITTHKCLDFPLKHILRGILQLSQIVVHPESVLKPSPSGICPRHNPRETSRGHPKWLPKPAQQTPYTISKGAKLFRQLCFTAITQSWVSSDLQTGEFNYISQNVCIKGEVK